MKSDLRQRTYAFALAIIKLGHAVNDRSDSWRVLYNQLLRCGTSISANVIEARSGSSRRDFVNFYNHALKLANESMFWLGLIRDSAVLQRGQVDPLITEADELARMLAASIITLKGNRKY